MSCFFDASSTAFPFEYKYPNGSIVQTGTLVDVAGYSSPVCVYDTEGACDNAYGGGGACCQATEQLASSEGGVTFIILAFFIVPYFVALFVLKRLGGSNPIGIWARLQQAGGGPPTPLQCALRALGALVFVCVIVATVFEATLMPTSIQQNLAPPDRASQLAMSAFLTPIGEIFAFLEDAMVVRVGYALAADRKSELNLLLHISTIGGLVCGVVAFLCMVAVAFNESAAAAVLNPSAGPNARLIDAGCALVPTTAVLLEHARVYFLLNSACWIPNFVTKGIVGFLVGTGNWGVAVLPTIVGATVPIGLWFGLLPEARADASGGFSPLSLLGLAYGSADWINATCFVVYFACARKVQRTYQLRLLWWPSWARSRAAVVDSNDARLLENEVGAGAQSAAAEGCAGAGAAAGGAGGASGASGVDGADVGTWATVKEVVFEGLELMLVDVAVQLSLTCTIYVAAMRSFETAYKLAAAQAAYWLLGPQYLVGSMYVLKLFGSRMVAQGQLQRFIRTYAFVGYMATAMAIGAVFTSYLKRDPLAYVYGESACVYASSPQCAVAYANIFGDHDQGSDSTDSLADVFEAFGPTVALNMLFLVLRLGLSCCHDFAFMARGALGAIVLVYVPAICVAHFVFGTAISYYIAMYAPHFALILVFGWRMVSHLLAMHAGRVGPWTAHATRSIGVGSDEALAGDAPPPEDASSGPRVSI